MNEPNYAQEISNSLSLDAGSVNNVLNLVDDDNTVHFIARYRKEKTGNLNEEQIRLIISSRDKSQNLYKAKIKAIKNIEEQGKLTEELRNSIEQAKSMTIVEDLYAPYKRKKKTKADIAREKGFEIITNQIIRCAPLEIPDRLKEYTREEIIGGAQDIIAQDIADSVKYKDMLRKHYTTYGRIISKKKTKIDEKVQKETYKFEIYSSFNQNIKKLKSYQTLAMNRGENIGILKVSLFKDETSYEKFLFLFRVRENELLDTALKEGYKKLFQSTQREIRTSMTEKASVEAIKVFERNLYELLMLKPHYGESVLAIDPGLRTGCKLCVLDSAGMPTKFDKLFLHKAEEEKLKKLFEGVDKVVIGNGTASKECYKLVKKVLGVDSILVNEDGASVYSASKIGQEEFPDLDLTNRGTISIGRRYIDSLSEIVKVPVLSMGVGMYQHDMNQKELETKLKAIVEDAVNIVGININSASPYLLQYVSGINKTSAKKIFANRPYKRRDDLLKILSAKAYQQAVGFLRVPESENKFDSTSIHPEQYSLAKFIVSKDCKNIFVKYESELKQIQADVTPEIVADIITNYEVKEIRQHEGTLKVKEAIKIEDLKEDDYVSGVIRNVTQFGAFVDIGLKNNGLIHISELADKFVKDPLDIVSIGQEVKARVIKIDRDNGKVGLSLKR
ncbi:S1 RNA-binding domain-containing protein [Candidatus Woesearchaeota archaeon]|nr:S1 RNA-binding domain-containing protein [Candidatus Woesearchaeota archaeon]